MNKKDYLEIRLQSDFALKWQPLLSHFLKDGLLVGTILVLFQMDLEWFAFPLFSILMFRNFSLMHDASHGAISRQKSVNNFIGFFCGLVSLLPFSAWREVHLQHHYWSGNIEKDPVMALRVQLPKAPQFLKSIIQYSWKYWFPLLAILQYCLFWKLGAQVAWEKKRFWSLSEVLTPVAAWTLLLFLSPLSCTFKIFIPGVLFYLILVEVVNFPHHLQLPSLDRESKKTVWEQEDTARTCLYPEWFAKNIVLNFNYHAEHHMFPDAPWYVLPSIHTKIKDKFNGPRHVDLNFSWTLKNRPREVLEVITESQCKEEAAS